MDKKLFLKSPFNPPDLYSNSLVILMTIERVIAKLYTLFIYPSIIMITFLFIYQIYNFILL